MKYEIYEPPCDRKSWYGKCAIYEMENGEKALRSYDTLVMTQDADGNLHRHWDGWSLTSSRHIWRGFHVDTPTFRKMEVERLPRKWRSLQETL